MAGGTERESESWKRLRKPRQTPAERAQRDEAIWRGWVAGKNERVLAFEFDLSVRVIKRVIADHKALVAEDAPSVEDFRTMIVEGTRDVIATMVEHMHRDPAPAYSNGRPILNDDGSTVYDYSLSLNAADRVLRAYERLGRITGVEAPDQNHVNVTIAAQSDAEIAAQEALARLMAAATPRHAITSTSNIDPEMKLSPGVPVTAEIVVDGKNALDAMLAEARLDAD